MGGGEKSLIVFCIFYFIFAIVSGDEIDCVDEARTNEVPPPFFPPPLPREMSISEQFVCPFSRLLVWQSIPNKLAKERNIT